MSWSVDETASFYDNENFTMQWCIISESLYKASHSKGEHGYGGIWGGMGATFHHNLLAHHSSRNPRFNGSRYHGKPDREIVDHRNNVIFNWGGNSAYGGEAGNQNVVANYYKFGPATKSGVRYRIVEPSDALGKWYVAENYVHQNPTITTNNWAGGVQGGYAASARASGPFPHPPVLTHSAEIAYEMVLGNAGAVLPVRDSIDARIVEEVRTGIVTHGGIWGINTGIIDSQEEVGGWPVLHFAQAPNDGDADGMPDTWEQAHGLSASDPADGKDDPDGDGYTNLEAYLNELCQRTDFLMAPGELSAIPAANNTIRLTWHEQCDNETGFVLERTTDVMAEFESIAYLAANDTSYTDNAVASTIRYFYRVRAVNKYKESQYSNIADAIPGNASRLPNANVLSPLNYRLFQNFPNPFNPMTKIIYVSPELRHITIGVLNIRGQEVIQLVDGIHSGGEYAIVFNGQNLNSGIYFYYLRADNETITRKMLLLR
jgi:hypothetical protein